MIGTVYVDQDVFRSGIKLIEGGIHGRVVGEVFELINLRLESIAIAHDTWNSLRP